ncbi:MAG: PAS domain-containing protein, partial [Candidatus Hydrothermarchaeaceae archaeon]
MRLHNKFIITFSIVSLVVLATGVAGLLIFDKVGKDIELVLEGKVGVADASIEVVNTVTSSEALLHEHMRTYDPERLNQIKEEMWEYHKLDNMWVSAIIHGTKSREFIESEEYSLWLKYGYAEKGIVIRKAEPDIVPLIEELDADHIKFHTTAYRLMELHRAKIEIQQNLTNLYSKEKMQRHMMRDIVDAQGDYQVMVDMWVVEYESKEAIFQYRDKKHIDEWLEAIETLQIDVANSTIAPEIKSEIQNQSAKYLSLAKPLSKETLRLNEADATIRAQMNILDEHITDMNANVDQIKAISFAARADAKREIRAYVTGMSTILAVAMAITLVLVLFSGYFTNRFISRPIVALRDVTRKTGEGDFDARIKVDRGDEIGELGTAFNEMTGALKKQTHDLGERIKELNCLYEVSRLSADPERSLSEIFKDTTNLIPTAWQYPEITCARLTYGGQEFTTENFKETEWRQFTNITASGTKVGSIEVYYLEERPEIDEGPFLKEEGSLIDTLGKQLGNTVERKEAEKALKSSKEFNETVLNSMNDAVSIIDVSDFRILGVNRFFLESLNLKEEEVLGKACYKITHHRDSPCTPPDDICPLLESVKTGKHSVFEHVHYSKAGKEVYVEVSASPIKDETGKVIQVVHVARDITERKRAEKEIIEAKGRLSALVDSVGDGIMTVNLDYTIADVNPAVCRMLGYTKKEILGKHCYEINHRLKQPCPQKEGMCSVREISESGAPLKVVHEHFTKSGNKIFVEITAAPIKDGDGRVVQIVEAIRDTTEGIMLEREAGLFREVNNLLNAGAPNEEVFMAITDGLTSLFGYKLSAIYVLDKARKSLTCKSYSIDSRVLAKAEKLAGVKALGYEAPLLEGSPLTEVIETKNPVIICDVVELIRSHVREKHLQALAPMIAKIVGLKCGIGVPLLAGDKLVGTIGIGSEKDITAEDIERLVRFGMHAGLVMDRAMLYEDLERAYEELKSIDELKGCIIDNVSHELRTPLTIAKGALE